jgi:hypothetical protein
VIGFHLLREFASSEMQCAMAYANKNDVAPLSGVPTNALPRHMLSHFRRFDAR